MSMGGYGKSQIETWGRNITRIESRECPGAVPHIALM